MTQSIIQEIQNVARKCFQGLPGSHNWDHTQRVRNLCLHIGRVEGADLTVLEISAYLHDVGRRWQDETRGRVCHAQKGEEIARGVLKDLPLAAVRKANILHCIRSHRFRGNHSPETPEARILFDADKLDAIGAIGTGRAFLFAGEVGARLHNPDVDPEETDPYTADDTGYREYRLKLSKIKDRMLTAEGRRLAAERHAFMQAFFERFLEEYRLGS